MIRFQATETFWRIFYALSGAQKERAREAWKIFRNDPFDPRLRPHKIHALSARAGRTVHSVSIEGDLRVVFCVVDDTVTTIDIGTHSIYK